MLAASQQNPDRRCWEPRSGSPRRWACVPDVVVRTDAMQTAARDDRLNDGEVLRGSALPAKREFFLPGATIRNARSATLLSSASPDPLSLTGAVQD